MKTKSITDRELVAFIVKCNGKSVILKPTNVTLARTSSDMVLTFVCTECGERHFVSIKEI